MATYLEILALDPPMELPLGWVEGQALTRPCYEVVRHASVDQSTVHAS